MLDTHSRLRQSLLQLKHLARHIRTGLTSQPNHPTHSTKRMDLSFVSRNLSHLLSRKRHGNFGDFHCKLCLGWYLCSGHTWTQNMPSPPCRFRKGTRCRRAVRALKNRSIINCVVHVQRHTSNSVRNETNGSHDSVKFLPPVLACIIQTRDVSQKKDSWDPSGRKTRVQRSLFPVQSICLEKGTSNVSQLQIPTIAHNQSLTAKHSSQL